MSDKKFRIYKSSAGSGKTFTLVSEFICLVILNPNHFRNILAITFTNKAANEMKARIVGSLVQLSCDPATWSNPLQKMIAPLVSDHKMSLPLIHERAITVVGNILHNYSDLSATTIDSFMQRVIRTFSLDLNLPQDYEVELDLDMLRQLAVDRLIDQAGSDIDLTDLLVRFLETKTEEDKSWRIEQDLNKIAKALFREDGIQHREALKNVNYDDFQDYYGKIIQWISAYEDQIEALGSQALNAVNNEGLSIADFTYGTSGPLGYFMKMQERRIGEVAQPSSRILKAVDDGAWTKKDQKPAVKAKIDAVVPKLVDYYHKSRSLLDHSAQRHATLSLLLRHLYPLGVLSSIEKMLREICAENKSLPISDFNRIIAQVTQTESIPYIYERLGERFHHLMIDEFQDTSVLQWQNLLPLVDNALSENHLNLVVGDAKQAIYRWRNGDVDQFISLPKLIPDENPINKLRENNLLHHHENLNLPVNWRSYKAIVEFNNHFFRHQAAKLTPEYQEVYSSLNQQYNPDKSGGYVQIEFFDPEDDSPTAMLERLPSLIEEIRSQNFMPGEIAVLCRTNKEGSAVAQHLLKKGIEVISAESLLLGNAQNVRLVMGMLRIVANAGDQLAYPEALSIMVQQKRFGTLTLNEIIPQAMVPDKNNPKRKVFDCNVFETLLSRNGIHFSRTRLIHLPLYELTHEIIRVLNLPYVEDIYLQFFLNELHRAITQKSMAIKDLLTWWEEKGRNVSVVFPESLDAVRVMTIHKSKGLEFPVVIYPFAVQKLNNTLHEAWVTLSDPLLPKLTTAWLPVKSLGGTLYSDLKIKENNKSLLDMINVLYVALTRAEERLYILTDFVEAQEEKTLSTSLLFADFIKKTEPDFEFTAGSRWIYPLSVDIMHTQPESRKEKLIFSVSDQTASRSKSIQLLTTSRPQHKSLVAESGLAVRFGTQVHEVLSLIRTPDDLEMVLDKQVRSGEIAAEDAPSIMKIISKILDSPELEPFFNIGNPVMSEPEILMPGGQIIRPDRVVLLEDKVLVAEFKTGDPKPFHESQLQGYMEASKNIQKSEVSGFLIYAHEDHCQIRKVNIITH